MQNNLINSAIKLFDMRSLQRESLINFFSSINDRFGNLSLIDLFKRYIECEINDITIEILDVKFIYKESNLDQNNTLVIEKGIFTADCFIIYKITNNNLIYEKEIHFATVPMITNEGFFIINGHHKIFVPTLVRKRGLLFEVNDDKYMATFYPIVGYNIGIAIEKSKLSFQIFYSRLSIDAILFVTALYFEDLHNCLENLFEVKQLDLISLRDLGELKFSEYLSNYKISLKTLMDYSLKNSLKFINFEQIKEHYISNLFNSDEIMVEYYLIDDDIKSLFNYTNYNFKLYENSSINEFILTRLSSKVLPKTLFNHLFKEMDFLLGFKARQFINETLNLNEESNWITSQDFILTFKKLFDMVINSEITDIYSSLHLKNRYLFNVDLAFYKDFRIILLAIKSQIIEKLNSSNKIELDKVFSGLINSKIISSKILLNLNSMSNLQFCEQTNPLSEFLQLNKITYIGKDGINKEQATSDIRNTHHSIYSRICSLATPEGTNSGLVITAAIKSKIDIYGNLLAPFHPVNQKLVDFNKIIYLSTNDEYSNDYYIAEYTSIDLKSNCIKSDKVFSKNKDKFILVDSSKINLVEINPLQIFSSGIAFIPFLPHNDANRTMTAGNMQKQALPLIHPCLPKVTSGIEKDFLLDSKWVYHAEDDGFVKFVNANKLIIEYKNGVIQELKLGFICTNQLSYIYRIPCVSNFQNISKGQIITTINLDLNKNGSLFYGTNLRTAVMPFDGYNFEDAVIVSDRCIKDNLFNTITTKEYICPIIETKFGLEITSNQLDLQFLDEDGVIKVGEKVFAGSILVAKYSPIQSSKSQSSSIKQKNIREFRSMIMEYLGSIKENFLYAEESGIVVSVFKSNNADNRYIRILVANESKLQKGDKLSNRMGNKMVVSCILPEQDMPFDKYGNHMDILINPLGIVSRMNIGQILELNATFYLEKSNNLNLEANPSGVVTSKFINDLLISVNSDGKELLFDGKTGLQFSKPVVCGEMYILKLEHTVARKYNCRSVGKYSLITQQPVAGRNNGGAQRLGYMEIWATQAHGMAKTIEERANYLADNVEAKEDIIDSIVKNKSISTYGYKQNGTLNLFINTMKCLCIKLDLISDVD